MAINELMHWPTPLAVKILQAPIVALKIDNGTDMNCLQNMENIQKNRSPISVPIRSVKNHHKS